MDLANLWFNFFISFVHGVEWIVLWLYWERKVVLIPGCSLQKHPAKAVFSHHLHFLHTCCCWFPRFFGAYQHVCLLFPFLFSFQGFGIQRSPLGYSLSSSPIFQKGAGIFLLFQLSLFLISLKIFLHCSLSLYAFNVCLLVRRVSERSRDEHIFSMSH